jgi:uncharacterized protein (DUF697 family)
LSEDIITATLSGTRARARDIVYRNSLWAAGLSLIPVPYFDAVAITTIQLKMIDEISRLYKVSIPSQLTKSILTSLLAGALVPSAVKGGFGPIVKSVPVVGPVLRFAVVPSLAAAATYAVGTIFTRAFEERNPDLLDGSHDDTMAALQALVKNGVPAKS